MVPTRHRRGQWAVQSLATLTYLLSEAVVLGLGIPIGWAPVFTHYHHPGATRKCRAARAPAITRERRRKLTVASRLRAGVMIFYATATYKHRGPTYYRGSSRSGAGSTAVRHVTLSSNAKTRNFDSWIRSTRLGNKSKTGTGE